MKKILFIVIFSLLTSMVFSQPWLNNLPQNKAKGELTLFDYRNAFNTYWEPYNVEKGFYYENGVKKKAKGWKQFKRWEYYMEGIVNPLTGEFPEIPPILNSETNNNKSFFKQTTANWINLGTNSTPGGYGGIGRINCIAFHPSDNNTYWVGTASGGLWVTTNNGSSWTCLTDNNAVLAVSDIVIPSDYSTSNTIYIATGDRDHWDNRSIGVLKSTDGGATWNATGIAYSLSNGKMINRLLLDPSNNQIILAATSDGVYKTTNGGTTWNTQLTANDFIDMEYKPGSFSTLYGSTTDGKIYVSANSGANWTLAFSDSDAERIELAVSANQPSWVYAVASGSDDGLYGVYKSSNSGVAYSQVFSGTTKNLLGWASAGDDAGGQGWYDLSIAASPSNANILLIGGINTWRSSNGGTTWSIINHWWGDGVPAVHADKHMLKYRSNGSLFECNDGGVYLSSDNGTTWADKTNGLVISQMYKLGVAETDQNEIITGLQDNGTKLFSGGNWYDVKGGDGMECLIDYADADVQYGTYVNGQISRTLDHWNSDTDIEPSGAGSGAWVTPFIIDPMNSQTLFAGYADVWKTANRGDSWTKISTINTSNKIRSMAIAPSDNRYLYVADYSHIWKTTIGGNTWTDITGTLPVGTNSITYIAVKYDDPNTLWVTLSAYNSNKVYQSADGGITWTNISAGLPSIPAYTIVQNKQSTSEVHLYVGTEVGVYFKKGSDNWIPYNTGLPNVKFGELEIYYSTNPENSKLRAATYGRGLWETSVYYNNTNPPLADFTVSSSSVCLSNPVGLNDFSSGSPSSWEWTITPSTFVFIGGTSSSSQNPLIQPTAFGYYTIKLKVTNSYGADSITKNNIIYVENSITTGISSVLLGSSTNAFSVVNNTSKQLIYNPSTNLLAFIHRNNQSLFGGNSGQLRYDFSIDTGSTWLCNAGPLNPTTTYQARYPQLSFYNPTGNTNYLNSYLVYHAPVLNPAWKGYVGGVRKMNGTGTTENYNQAGTANTLIPGGLHQSISGTYWAIDNIYDSAAANELGYKVIKGVWSGSNITWSNSYSILPSFDVNYNGKNHTTSLAIDFSLDGQIGYMIFLAHLSGTTSYYQYSPVYYKTTNGGNTWIGPYYIDLNSLPEITSFVPAGYFPDAGWQVDVAVDYNNHPHFFIGAHYGDGLSYSIFHPTVLFDITTVDDVNFIANEISRPKTWLTEFVDTYSYNQLQICTTPDKKNIFFSWIDTDTLGGNWMNNAPDLFVRGYNAELKSFSNIKSVTRCTSISGEIFFPKISKTAIVSNNIIQIPAVYTTFSTPFDPNYRVDYNYIKGIKFNKCELYPFPNPVVTPTNSIICQGDSALLNSTSTTGCNVAWFKDNNLILGANTYQYYAKSTGQYNTKETSICYSNISSNIVNVNANPTPATPVVSQISNYLHSTATTGNQWYFNNVLLPSETGQNYTPTQNGNYFVIVTSADNCVSDTSNIFNFVMSGIGELSNKFFIKVYPNPVGNEFKIDLEGNNETLSFEIYNSVGTLVLKSTIKNKAIVQSINFPAGVYMLKLFDETFLELIKVVKK